MASLHLTRLNEAKIGNCEADSARIAMDLRPAYYGKAEVKAGLRLALALFCGLSAPITEPNPDFIVQRISNMP